MPRKLYKRKWAAAEPTEVPDNSAEASQVAATTAEPSQVAATTAEPSTVADASEVSAEDFEVGVKTVASAVAVEVAATTAEAVGVAPDELDNDNVDDKPMSSHNAVAYSKNPKAESCADPVLVDLHNNMLRMSDIKLLHGPHFLNDAVLGFYMTYLDQIKYKPNLFYLFVTPELSQCLPYMDKKQQEMALLQDRLALTKSFIFFAVNDGLSNGRDGIFWSLLVASRPNNSFYHFASYSNNNIDNAVELFNSIKDVVGMPEASFRVGSCTQHKKDYDCGIHVMCMVDHLVDHVICYNTISGVKLLPRKVIKIKRNTLITLIASLSKLGKH
ncbi:sentrin-specific protease 8 [Drosophila grimshawi]|uniref:GH12897 n=1 Tax=Drosophila grimshawi TaxID=7222 RepID=B4JIN6_DROGR|nr:sentrin-specific protease 8 [Drosophila grimshawi]EDW00483.1 GH12897 [Drosophila grimshawi]